MSTKLYREAQERYGEIGVDTDKAIRTLSQIPLSIHCWQGDDVIGFDGAARLSGGILATGAYPGRARNAEELRRDIEKAFSLIPGTKRLNLHAMYAETNGAKVDRDQLEPKHFDGWLAWAKGFGIGLDFNPSFFSHPLAESGFTLAHADPSIRNFWIRHGIASRQIAQFFADELKDTVVNNLWVPDGYKDTPADRLGPRIRLQDSLDQIYHDSLPNDRVIDSVESKLFGIGSESYVAGSHEFYLGYAAKHALGLCLDMGHFHPTEQIADKISSVLLFIPKLVLHLSRGVHWDSDHIVVWNDDISNVAHELVRIQAWDRVYLALDYFDASINRIGAWVIGARSVQKALLSALLEPSEILRDEERHGNYFKRLAYLEESKSMPFSAVWNYYCETENVPENATWIDSISEYERLVLSKREG